MSNALSLAQRAQTFAEMDAEDRARNPDYALSSHRCMTCTRPLTINEARWVTQFCGREGQVCSSCAGAIKEHGALATLVAFAFKEIARKEPARRRKSQAKSRADKESKP